MIYPDKLRELRKPGNAFAVTGEKTKNKSFADA